MTIITRVTRLLKADLHGLLDCVEEPELLLKQAIRDMEAEHLMLRQQRDDLLQEREQIQQRQQKQQQELVKLEEGLGLCLEQENDDLARTLLRKQLLAQRDAERCADLLDVCQRRLIESGEQLEQQRCDLDQIRQRASALVTANSAGATSRYSGNDDLAVITEADIELALLQAKSSAKRGEL